jgi:hypothetical protein
MIDTSLKLFYPGDLRSSINDAFEKGVNMPYIHFKLDNTGAYGLESGNVPEMFMYIPPNFAIGDSINYGTADLGILGSAAKSLVETSGESGIESAKAIAKKAMTNSAAQNVDAGLSTLKEAATLGTLKSTDTINNIVGDGGVSSGIGIGLRKAINPYQAVQFDNVGLRTYGFSFVFMPESQYEAKMVKDIVNTFRKYSLPANNGPVLDYPANWIVNFKNGADINTFMPRLLPSYCTSVNVSYNASSSSYHEDGSPMETALSLTFTETSVVTQNTLYYKDSLDPKDNLKDNSINIGGLLDKAVTKLRR